MENQVKTREISMTLSRKVSDNNYGSYGADISMTLELEEGDNTNECIAKLRSRLEKQLEKTIEDLQKRKE